MILVTEYQEGRPLLPPLVFWQAKGKGKIMTNHLMSETCLCGASFHLKNDSLYGFCESERAQFYNWRERHGECSRPAAQTINIERAIIINSGPSFANLAREGSRRMFDTEMPKERR